MKKLDFTEEAKTFLIALNARLKAAQVPVAVRLGNKSSKLLLRATLPKKPGTGSGKAQYDISLGIPLTREGLKRIEREAHVLGDRMASGHFDWSLYLTEKNKDEHRATADLVADFKVWYMAQNDIQETTWRESWQRTFDRLPQDEALSRENIELVVRSIQDKPRLLEQTCQRLQKLADFAGVIVELKAKAADRTPKERIIPSDELIVEWRDRIPNEQWQWVYGMLATFGLRGHEVFLCEFVDRHTIKVLDGKTKDRIVRAIRPEWVELWKLQEIKRPNVSGRVHRDLGQRVSRQFERYQVPYPPYSLRHAYAIRGSVVMSLPVKTMAMMMGHSVQTHTNTYLRWLNDAVNEKVYREKILGDFV